MCSPIFFYFFLLFLNSRVFLGMCVEEQTAPAFSLLTSCCVWWSVHPRQLTFSDNSHYWEFIRPVLKAWALPNLAGPTVAGLSGMFRGTSPRHRVSKFFSQTGKWLTKCSLTFPSERLGFSGIAPDTSGAEGGKPSARRWWAFVSEELVMVAFPLDSSYFWQQRLQWWEQNQAVTIERKCSVRSSLQMWAHSVITYIRKVCFCM